MQYSNVDASSVVIPVENIGHRQELGKTLIIAERRETSYQPSLSHRSALDAARNGVNAHLDRKGKKRYPPGKGLKSVNPKDKRTDSDDSKPTSTSKIDNTRAIDMDAPDAKEQLDRATQSWAKPSNTSSPQTTKPQPAVPAVTLGEEL